MDFTKHRRKRETECRCSHEAEDEDDERRPSAGWLARSLTSLLAWACMRCWSGSHMIGVRVWVGGGRTLLKLLG